MRANTLTPFASSAAVRRSSVVAKSCELCSVTSPLSGTADTPKTTTANAGVGCSGRSVGAPQERRGRPPTARYSNAILACAFSAVDLQERVSIHQRSAARVALLQPGFVWPEWPRRLRPVLSVPLTFYRPRAEEPYRADKFTQLRRLGLRCAASRTMRARRSSGCRPSFETRRCATLLWMRWFRQADSRLAHEPLAVVSNSRCQTAQCSSFPRRVLAPGFVFISSPPTPIEGRAERRQAHSFCCRVCETRLVRAGEARRVP